MNKIPKDFFILLSILSLTAGSVFAQYNQEWMRQYNGAGNSRDEAVSHCTDHDGNILTAGSTVGTGTGLDMLIAKYSPSGNLLWERVYNGAGNNFDIARRICADNDGNVIVIGECTGIGSGRDITVIKYSSSGDLLWQKFINGTGNNSDVAAGIRCDGEGNIYAFSSLYQSASAYDFAIIKFSPTGDQIWISYFNGTGNGNDLAADISLDNSGNIFVAGGSIGTGTANDIAVVKYDSNGNQLWSATYNGPASGNDNFPFLAVDHLGNAIVTGSSVGAGTGIDFVTLKYSPSGQLLWTMRYNGPDGTSFDEPKAICTDASANVVVTGSSIGQSSSYDYATVKYSPSGDELWVRRYNGPGNLSFDEARSVCSDEQGNFIVAGISGTSSLGDDIVMIRYDLSGNETWFHRFNFSGTSNEKANTISRDNSSNLIVSGSLNSNTTAEDMLVMKYSLLTGSHETIHSLPTEFKLKQNYPNPFNPVTTISFTTAGSASSASNFRIDVFNAAGKFVRNIYIGSGVSVTRQVIFNAEGLPSGTYHYCLLLDGKLADAKTMILLK